MMKKVCVCWSLWFAYIALIVAGFSLSLHAESAEQPNAVPAIAGTPALLSPERDASLPAHPFVPGNAVKIMTYPDTNSFINSTYHIDSDGQILLPILGRKKISDYTEAMLCDFIDSAYAEYLHYPNTQTVPLMRISLLGGFARPGLYYIDPHISLWDAVYIAGGTLREDGYKQLRWERSGNIIQKKLTTILEAGTSLNHLEFVSGDQIWVTSRPKRNFWDIFRGDVMPTLTFTLSASTTAFSAYQMYKILKKD